jgi:hypothetical protein
VRNNVFVAVARLLNHIFLKAFSAQSCLECKTNVKHKKCKSVDVMHTSLPPFV